MIEIIPREPAKFKSSVTQFAFISRFAGSSYDLSMSLGSGSSRPDSIDTQPSAEVRGRAVPWTIFLLLVAIVLGTAATLVYWKKVPPPTLTQSRKSLIRVPGTLRSDLRSFGISPDGSRLAYISGDRLFIQNLADFEPRPREVPQSGGASCLFWSPDGRSLGFAVGREIYRVLADGAQPER